VPHHTYSPEQPELADATAAADVTCHIQVAPAAAAAKCKQPRLKSADCDTAAALAGLADNKQQHSKQLHACNSSFSSGGGGGDIWRQGWQQPLCSWLAAACVQQAVCLWRWRQPEQGGVVLDDVDGWHHVRLVVASCRSLLADREAVVHYCQQLLASLSVWFMALFVEGRRLHHMHRGCIIMAPSYVCNSTTPNARVSVKVVSQQMTFCLVCSIQVSRNIITHVFLQFTSPWRPPSSNETQHHIVQRMYYMAWHGMSPQPQQHWDALCSKLVCN
jgi:hypothetical protein